MFGEEKKIYGAEMPQISFTVERTMTVEDMEDIFTTAVESGYSGIGYWASLDDTTADWKTAEKQIKDAGASLYLGTIMTKILLNGGTIKIGDVEEDPIKYEWELNMEKFKEGCKLYSANRGDVLLALKDGAFDAVEADCLIQYAVFGEIVFA